LLDDAVGAFLEQVSERAFDEPLMALLRVEGYTEVRLVHGQFEAGKDVIAQKDGEQWVFQSKAGNLTMASSGKCASSSMTYG
jgi:HJR/Mrr/RecB family endonuclease